MRASSAVTAAETALDWQCDACGEAFPKSYRVCPHDATPLGAAQGGADPLVGMVLASTYRILRPLRNGGMGRLYEAEHTRLGRRYALKIIHDAYADNPDTIRRFEREARAASRIASPYVLNVVDVVRAPDGRPCIVSELLEGEDLQHRLDRIRWMAVPESVAIARQICLGLAAAHAHGVIHRDLKPSNVFLASDADGQVTAKILDFGVAKVLDDARITKSGAVVGTPAYMAPEQASGAPCVDHRVDIYGAGAVLYRMLTGSVPHAASSAMAALADAAECAPKRPRVLRPAITKGLERVLLQAMDMDPSSRPDSAVALERSLRVVALGDPQPEIRVLPWAADEANSPNGERTLVLPPGSVRGARSFAHKLRNARRGAVRWAFALTALGAISAAVAAAAWTDRDLRLVAPAFIAVGAFLAWRLGRAVRSDWCGAADLAWRASNWSRTCTVFTLGIGVTWLIGQFARASSSESLGLLDLSPTATLLATWAVALAARSSRTLSRVRKPRRKPGPNSRPVLSQRERPQVVTHAGTQH